MSRDGRPPKTLEGGLLKPHSCSAPHSWGFGNGSVTLTGHQPPCLGLRHGLLGVEGGPFGSQPVSWPRGQWTGLLRDRGAGGGALTHVGAAASPSPVLGGSVHSAASSQVPRLPVSVHLASWGSEFLVSALANCPEDP